MGRLPAILRESVSAVFASPVVRTKVSEREGKEVHSVYLASSVCFNFPKMEKILSRIPGNADVRLVMTRIARVVDHTTMEHLHYFQEMRIHGGGRCRILGLEKYHRLSGHPLSAGLRDGRFHRKAEILSERQEFMKKLAEKYRLHFSPAVLSSTNEAKFIYCDRGTEKEEMNIITGMYKNCEMKIFDYSYTDIPHYFLDTRHTMIELKVSPSVARIPDFVLDPDHYVGKYLVDWRDVHLPDALRLSRDYHLRGEDEERIRDFLSPDLIRFLGPHPKFYVEARDNHMLAFRVDQDLEDIPSMQILFDFADVVVRACA